MFDIVSLAAARQQVRLEEDDTDEDATLTGYIVAAERVALGQLGLASAAALPPADIGVVRLAMLMMVGHWFVNREAQEPPSPALWLLGTIGRKSL